MEIRITRRSSLFALAGGVSFIADLRAQQGSSPTKSFNPVVVTNVTIFNGVDDQLRPGNILVSDRKIKQISSGVITPPSGSTVVEGGGRVLMPGLSDAHCI